MTDIVTVEQAQAYVVARLAEWNIDAVIGDASYSQEPGENNMCMVDVIEVGVTRTFDVWIENGEIYGEY